MEQLQPTSILSLFETNKQQRASFINQVIETLQEGQIDPLKLHLQVKCTEQLLSELKDRPEYKESVLSEAAKHGKKFEHYNAEFQVKEAVVKYDFTVCGSSELMALYQQQEELTAKVKKLENSLKGIDKFAAIDTDTGEVLIAPIKTSTTIVQVTLK